MAAPPDVQATLRSQDFYRLKQVVQSPGSIYEIDVGTKAVYIGPDSDIAEVELTYFNPDAQGALETAVVSVNGPFVGSLFALNKTIVPSTNQPARILVSPVDVVNNTYSQPGAFGLRFFNVPAMIDLIASLQPIHDVPSVRADKTFRLPSVPFDLGLPDTGSTYLNIPIYGRRMITIAAFAEDDVAIDVALVSLLPGSPTAQRNIGVIDIASTGGSGFKNTQSYVIRASDAGRQGNNYSNAGALTGIYDESDQTWSNLAGSPSGFSSLITPRSRGMADLLSLRIADNSGDMGTGTRYIDLYIKVSDREN